MNYFEKKALEACPDTTIKYGPEAGKVISHEEERRGYVLGFLHGQDEVLDEKYESHTLWFAKTPEGTLCMTAIAPGGMRLKTNGETV